MFLINDETLKKVALAIGGEEAVKVIDVLKQVKETTDDDIANKTEIRLNIIRRILYKFYDHSLVGMRRTRDQNTGWFVFHWRLDANQLKGFISNQKRRIMEKLEVRLEYEKGHDFYYCGTPNCRKIPFEDAVELIFECSTCGKSLNHFTNEKIIEALSKRNEQIRKEMSE